MEKQWLGITIVVVCPFLLLAFYLIKNPKDKKGFIKTLDADAEKTKEHGQKTIFNIILNYTSFSKLNAGQSRNLSSSFLQGRDYEIELPKIFGNF